MEEKIETGVDYNAAILDTLKEINLTLQKQNLEIRELNSTIQSLTNWVEVTVRKREQAVIRTVREVAAIGKEAIEAREKESLMDRFWKLIP